MTPRDRIAVLLHHYRDVCEGIAGIEPAGDDVLALMCEEWNHSSYQQLERLLVVMHDRWPRMRQAVRTHYERYSEHRIAWCRRCGAHPVANEGRIHLHPPGRSVTLVAKVVRVYPSNDNLLAIQDALDWLENHWAGEVDLPKAVMDYTSSVALREVA